MFGRRYRNIMDQLEVINDKVSTIYTRTMCMRDFIYNQAIFSSPCDSGTNPDAHASILREHGFGYRKENARRSFEVAKLEAIRKAPVLDALFQASQKVSADTGNQPPGRPAPCHVALQTARCCQGRRCRKLSSVQSKRHSGQIVSIGVLSKRRCKAHRWRRCLR